MNNLNELLEEAKNNKAKVLAIAAAEDQYVLSAIEKAKKYCLIIPLFIGDKDKIKAIANEKGINISDQEIVDEPDNNSACMKAVQLVSEGKADILMKGLVSTGVLLKHVVSKEYGLLSGKLLSHLAIFESPNYHKLLGVTDAAMNISPSLEDKITILQNSVEVFHKLGLTKPKVSILAAVEKVNSKMPATTDAIELKKLSQTHKLGSCLVDGPFALDNAVSREASVHKGINSEVAGDTDILLAPDINTGNVLYKSLSFLGNARCAAIIVGSIAPIVLTSRADSEETKFLSIALGALTAK